MDPSHIRVSGCNLLCSVKAPKSTYEQFCKNASRARFANAMLNAPPPPPPRAAELWKWNGSSTLCTLSHSFGDSDRDFSGLYFDLTFPTKVKSRSIVMR